MKAASFLSPGQFQSKSIRLILAVALIPVTGRVILANYVTMTLLSVLRSREGSLVRHTGFFLTHFGSLCDFGHFRHDTVHSRPPALYTRHFLVLSSFIRCHITFLSLSDFIYAKLLLDLRHVALSPPIYDTLWSALCQVGLSPRLSSSFD